ncbi:MAG TPA: ThiF family adenylyltransferase [Solirubrobacterales bacterium]|nr:ThiF family adenylyltransferase [Solirubrobacterales bacterium]
MSKSITRASADLLRLENEGYELEIRGGYLLVHSVPYVTPERVVASGTLVSTLQLAGEVTARPDQHEAHFIGAAPCDARGNRLESIINNSDPQQLAESLRVDHYLSSKPIDTGRYEDYWQKMTSYITIISAPAQAIDPTATARTYPVLIPDPEEEDPIFNYTETASSRAGILAVTEKLRVGPVAIIGLGGTGAYILDFLAKTPVAEIHLFDGDRFSQHNAFRAPGAPTLEELRAEPQKVEHLKAHYSPMRRGIVAHDVFVEEGNVAELEGMDFVFLALDESEPKRCIVTYLEQAGIGFIDVGMGVDEVDGALRGMVQTTLSTPTARDHLRRRVSLEDPRLGGDYDQNIQIAELNALNAAIAVIRWKRLLGFYADDGGEHSSFFVIETNQLLGEDRR